MEYEYDHDGWTTCPYNPAHRVPRSRIQYHIVKCQKSYPALKICPYNATHRFTEGEMKTHIKNCPNKPITDMTNTGGNITVPKPILQKDYLPDSDHESWDKP